MILRKAYAGYLQPRILDAPWQGLAVNALAGAVNGGWCWTLIRNGRRLRSPSLVADGRHLLMAVISSGGVLVGVALAALTGWTVLDPALAAGVAVTSFRQAGGSCKTCSGASWTRLLRRSFSPVFAIFISEHANGELESRSSHPPCWPDHLH